MRARTDGSGLTVLVQRGDTDEDRHDRMRHCIGVEVDSKAGHIYWDSEGPTWMAT